MPAIRFLHLAQAADDTDDADQAVSVDPVTSGAPLWACTVSRIAGTPVEPTLSGTNGVSNTWTSVVSATVGNLRMTLFRSTAASGTSGTLTATYGAETQLAKGIMVVEGVNCNSDTPVQTQSDAETGVTSINLDTPLSSFSNANNALLTFVCNSLTFGSNFSTTEHLSFLQVANGSGESGGPSFRWYWMPGGSLLSPTISFSSSDSIMIAAEIAHDGSDAGSGGEGPMVGGRLVGGR